MPALGIGALNRSKSYLSKSGRLNAVMSAAMTNSAARSCGAAVSTKSAMTKSLTESLPVMANDPAMKQLIQSSLTCAAARPCSFTMLVTFPGVPMFTGIVTVFERSTFPTFLKVSTISLPISSAPCATSWTTSSAPWAISCTPFEMACPMSLKKPRRTGFFLEGFDKVTYPKSMS